MITRTPPCRSFLTLIPGVLGACLWSSAADAQVGSMNLTYLSQYPQTGPNPPTITTDHSVTKAMSVTTETDIETASVTDPFFNSLEFFSPNGIDYFTNAITAPTRGALMAAQPAGDYEFAIEGGDYGPDSATVNQTFGLGDWPAEIPAFTSTTYNLLSGMPTDVAFTVNFNSFTPTVGATGTMLLYVSEAQSPFGLPVFESLPATATSFTIPAGTLAPNTQHYISLTFDNVHTEFGSNFGTFILDFQQQTYILFTTGNGTTPSCVADVDDGTATGTPDGGVTIDDLLYYLNIFNLGDISADVDDGSATGTPDAGVTIDDLLYFLTRFNAGC